VTHDINDLEKALLATGFPYDRRDHGDFYLNFLRRFWRAVREFGATARRRSTFAMSPPAGSTAFGN
jgi:hypothetical protein